MAKFHARARTLDMLGRQQIAGVPTALHELFKNAYDAYAFNVEVDYFRKRGILLLRDDGVGMSLDDFQSKWLTLATESKVAPLGALTPSPREGVPVRPVMGEKGIGRLAIATIGSIVLVMTRAEGSDEIICCLIHWGLFELTGIDLGDIDLPVKKVSAHDDLNADLIAKLKSHLAATAAKVSDKTTDPRAKQIKAEIEGWNVPLHQLAGLDYGPSLSKSAGTHFLVHPVRDELAADIDEYPRNGASSLQRMLLGFSSSVGVSNEAGLETSFRDHLEDGQVVDRISDSEFFVQSEYEMADHRVSGKFDEYGNFSGSIAIYGGDEIDFSIPIFTDRKIRACGPFALNFAYVQGQKSDTTIPMEEYAGLTRKLDRIGGLYIYKNGIRVLPYGNSDYDFLEIERRRTLSASYYFFSYRRMFGSILTDAVNNSGLQEKAGREGFQSNKAYRHFREQLMVFFEELAARFFREDGSYAETWTLQRSALQREYKLLQKRKRSVKLQRDKLSSDLGHFFTNVEADIYVTELAGIKADAETRIQALLSDSDMSDVARSIISIEREVLRRASDVLDELTLSRPRAVGLTKSLSREWERYQEVYEKRVAPDFSAFEAEIATSIGQLAEDAKQHLDAKMRLEASIDAVEARSKEALDAEQRETSKSLENTERFVRSQLTEARGVVQDTKDEVARSMAEFDFDAASQDELEDLRVTLEAKLVGARKVLEDRLGVIRLQLDRIQELSDEDSLGADVTISALETELEVLKEDYGQTLELAQLGMAVSIVQHEFESNIRGVRKSLKSMSKWANQNEGLKALYQDIRDGFDHLDNYLSLFTPLDKRLRRRKTEITGGQIASFIRDLFDERFDRHKIDFSVTEAGAEQKLESYSSVILPVFVNLVDNAVHWLSKKDGKRNLVLDAVDSYFVVEDSGPGVSRQDREFIFEFGYSRKLGGQGMGLYIAKTSLNKEDLDIQLDPTSTTGARFLIGPKDVS